MKKNKAQSAALAAGAVFFWMFAAAVQAAQLRIDQIDAGEFPRITIYTTVTDKSQNPLTDVKEESWQYLEDGVPSRAKIKITPFQFSREGIALVVIVGASGIMKGRPLESEKKAVLNLAANLQPLDKITVLAYGDRVETISGFDATADERRKQVKTMKTFGNTVTFYDALWQGIETLLQKPGLPARKAIIIVSDGRDNGSAITREEVLNRIKKSNIPVYGIGYSLLSPRYLTVLKKITRVSGGTYLYAKRDKIINSKLKKILDQLKKGYVIQTTSKHIPGDGQVHQLTIKVKKRGKILADTKGFNARKNPITLLQLILRIVIIVLLAALVIGLVLWYFMAPVPGYKRKCPQCKRVMKDEWDECVFCRYIPLYPKEALKTKR